MRNALGVMVCAMTSPMCDHFKMSKEQKNKSIAVTCDLRDVLLKLEILYWNEAVAEKIIFNARLDNKFIIKYFK